MTTHSTREKVLKVLRSQFGETKELAESTDETRIIQDLGADSLDQIEILMALEDAFEIEFPEDAKLELLMPTIGAMVTDIETRLA